MRSLCRGVARKMPQPKRSKSKRAAPAAIISMAQQARPKVMGQTLVALDQLMIFSTLVVMSTCSRAVG